MSDLRSRNWCQSPFFSSRFVRGLLGAVVLGCGASSLAAAGLTLKGGSLWLGEEKFVVRGVAYSNAAIGERAGPSMSSRTCLFARDLPLIARMGANTVRTYALLPEGDTVFVRLLGETGLYWLAGFPLEPYYDPARGIADRKLEILDAFRRYASRFRGEPRLIGYVFGNEVTEDYGSKFRGSPEEFYELLAEAAAVLAELEPAGTALLTAAVRDSHELRKDAPGLSFWSWNAYPGRSFGGLLDEIRQSASKPVLVAEYGVDAFHHFAGQEDEQAQAVAAAALTNEIRSAGHLLGGVYASFVDEWWRGGEDAERHSAGGSPHRGFPDGYRNDGWFGIFRATATEQPGMDGLHPRAVFRILTSLWGGRVPASWSSEDAPRIARFENAASGEALTSPGGLVKLSGASLSEGDAFASPPEAWRLHFDTACLCVDGSAAALGLVSADNVTAQTPWEVPPGERKAVLYRAGRPSNFAPTRVEKYSPAIFPEAVLRGGTDCRVSAENGVRPGQILEVYATGLGAGPFSEKMPEALINNTPAEVLYAGLLPVFAGLNQVNIRVNPATPPSVSSHLELRMDGASSNLYAMNVAGPSDRAGIVLSYSGEEVQLQAGGEPRTVPLHVEGTNGYCGPVLFLAHNPPAGISFQSPVAFTGHAVPLEIRAGLNARTMDSGAFVLVGHASGTTSGSVAIRLTVLPNWGDIPVRVISGGFQSQPLARFDWNGRTLFATTGGGPGRGISVLAVNASTGVFSPVETFDTWGDETAAARLVSYLSALPGGAIALFAVADEGSLQLSREARDAIAAMFGSRSIQGLEYQQAWAMIARKGASAPIAEGASLESQVILDRVLTLPQP